AELAAELSAAATDGGAGAVRARLIRSARMLALPTVLGIRGGGDARVAPRLLPVGARDSPTPLLLRGLPPAAGARNRHARSRRRQNERANRAGRSHHQVSHFAPRGPTKSVSELTTSVPSEGAAAPSSLPMGLRKLAQASDMR